jgi:hypothetical protein
MAAATKREANAERMGKLTELLLARAVAGAEGVSGSDGCNSRAAGGEVRREGKNNDTRRTLASLDYRSGRRRLAILPVHRG